MTIQEILHTYWGHNDFRGVQQPIIESIMAGHDTLGLMPTGGGKSITFQVPTMAMTGMCLVITPLIALMKDQVQNLRRRGILAEAIYTGMQRNKTERILDNAVLGAYKFLYVSPERLANSAFIQKLQRMNLCLITVDEAHCISQWGYDFRPHYLRIAEVRQYKPNVPVLALTATATPSVVDDIQDRLAFKEHRVFQMSFERKNLHYIVRATKNKDLEMLHILRCVEGSAIIYTRNRKETKQIAEFLESNGLTATYYHAGLPGADKEGRQMLWQQNGVRIMVATNAFGMGIDKPDVRLVIHMDVPDSIEAYFQEAGRGGRDGQVAYGVLLYDKDDAMRLRKKVAQAFPDREYIRKVYSNLASFFQVAEGEGEGRTFDFPMEKFCRCFHHSSFALIGALNLLEQAGYIHFALEDEHHSRVMFLVQRDELYNQWIYGEAETVMLALLRKYTGLFADYTTIDERELEQYTGLSANEVYDNLCLLTRQRIIHYVPHKHIPQITYLQRRVDSERLEIRKAIYEDRRDCYSERVEKMIAYFSDSLHCRSQLLLEYFGDHSAEPCGYCDNCIAQEKAAATTPPANIDDFLLKQIAEKGNQIRLEQLDYGAFRKTDVDQALRHLVQEQQIAFDGTHLSLEA